MSDVLEGADVQVKTITVVQVGQDKQFIEVPADATWSQVWEKVGGDGRKVTHRNEEIQNKADQPIGEDATVVVGPRQGKAGR